MQESSFIVQPSTNVGQLTSNKKYKQLDKIIRSTFDDTVKIEEEFEGLSNNPSEPGQVAENNSQRSENEETYYFRQHEQGLGYLNLNNSHLMKQNPKFSQ